MPDQNKRQRQTETLDHAKCKNTNHDCMMRKRQTEMEEQAEKHKNTNHNCTMRKQQTETSDQAAKRKDTNCDCIMRK
jgi:hypothetical protein